MMSKKVCEDSFKQAMACFPSGVTIVTTVDDTGQKCGFTASAFSSLSLTPPLILVCLANNADCFDNFNNQKPFAVNIIGPEHEALAFKFATKVVINLRETNSNKDHTGFPFYLIAQFLSNAIL